jgi:hypothetical protein
VGAALGGHPLRLRQTISRARAQGLSIEALAPRTADTYDQADLSQPELDVARTLAVHGHAPLGLEHIEALAGPAAHDGARALKARHDARSHSPRYSLVGAIGDAFTDGELEPEIDSALVYFASWTESDARAARRERVLAEADALVELLARAHRVKRHAEVMRLGVAIEPALAWGNRWRAWGEVLELVLKSARATGETGVEALAMHQLGTRQFGLGNAAGAAPSWRARSSCASASATMTAPPPPVQNLEVVSHPAPLLKRLSHASNAVFGVIAALIILAAIAASVALSVTVKGTGRVTSAPAGIDCAKRCSARFERRTVRLVAKGERFNRWGGACRANDGPTCRVRVGSDTRVVAVFDGPALTLLHAGAGRGTVLADPGGRRCAASCTIEDLRSGDVVTLSTTAAADSVFAGWDRPGCSGTGPCTVVMHGSTTVTARFGHACCTLTTRLVGVTDEVTMTVQGQRRIDCLPGVCRFSRGTVVTLRHVRAFYAEWRGCDSPPGDYDPCIVTMNTDRVVSAEHSGL